MSLKAMLKSGTAALVFAGTIAIGSAAAQSYYDYPQRSYSHHHHHYRHTAYRSTSSRGMRREEMGNPDEMGNRDEMSGREELGRNVPPAMQVPLITIRDADAIKKASVRDEDGNSIGSVKDVVMARNGEPRAVKVNVGGFWGYGSKVATIDAQDLLYERDRNELTADMKKDEINKMASQKGENEQNGENGQNGQYDRQNGRNG